MSKYDKMTKDELMEEAQRLDIDGRSTMDKAELKEAVVAADGGGEDKPQQPVSNPEAEEEGTGLVGDNDAEREGEYHPQGAGEGETADEIPELEEREEPIAGDTDVDPILDSEADYTPAENQVREDTGGEETSGEGEGDQIKSRQQEEDEQVARTEAKNAEIEETIANAETSPW